MFSLTWKLALNEVHREEDLTNSTYTVFAVGKA
jgi:hypothetical protein